MASADIFEGISCLLLACYQFLGISILCDSHLCPALEKLCERFQIPTALAAASLLSFGSSAPELVIAAFGAASDKTELSVPAILTSALIAFAAIPPLVVWAVGPITLHIKEVVRDALFYAVALMSFIAFNRQPEIDALSAFSLVMFYFLYLAVVYKTESTGRDTVGVDDWEIASGSSIADPQDGRGTCQQCDEVGQDPSDTPSTACTSGTPRHFDPAKDRASGPREPLLGQEGPEESAGLIVSWLQLPFERAFAFSVSSDAVAGFAASMAWLCTLSYGAVWCASRVAQALGISSSTAGITVLAWGGQLPDAIAAMSLARCGEPDAAISQAIASQVINVTIGLGMPFLAYRWMTGKQIVTQHHSVVLEVALAVLCSIAIYLVALAHGAACPRWGTMQDCGKWTATITRPRAAFLGICFILLYGVCIIVCEVQGNT